MLRILAFIAVLALWDATASGVLAQAQSKSSQKGCYNSSTCASNCRRNSVGTNCELFCQRQASTRPPCK
jgi:hypothetical protein